MSARASSATTSPRSTCQRRRSGCTATAATVYTGDALIIATGAQAKWLGLPGEQQFKGFGVSACATCDGFFYRGKEVVVIGGGNTAVEEALYLTSLANKVTLIHRRDSLRAEKILQDRLFGNAKIKVIWDTVVDDVRRRRRAGRCRSPALKLRNVKTGAMSELAGRRRCSSPSAMRRRPSSSAASSSMKPGGYIWTAPHSTATTIPGVFAAGDVTRRGLPPGGDGGRHGLHGGARGRALSRRASSETAEAAE